MSPKVSNPGADVSSLPDGAVRGRWRVTAMLSLALAAVIAIVYWPALKHFPHSDQFSYFVDTIDCDGFLDRTMHSYSYARTRLQSPGDTQLFRPVLFAWLSGLQAVLGLHWEWCQALSIGLHVLICILLLVLFEQVFRGARRVDGTAGAEVGSGARSPFTYLPFALVYFFALNYAIVEQVIWYHIQGYLLAIALIVVSVLLLVRATEAHSPRRRGLLLAAAWGLLLVAAFTYELGQFSALCAGLFLLTAHSPRGRRRWRAALAFFSIVAIYQTANHFDRWLHAATYQDDLTVTSLVATACNLATLEHSARYCVYTIVQPFLPTRISIHSIGKIFLSEQVWNDPIELRGTTLLGGTVLALWAGLVLLGFWQCRKQGSRPWLALAGLLGGIGLAQAAMIVLGRMNMRPSPLILKANSHYIYMGLLFALAVSAIGIAQAQRWRSTLGQRLTNRIAALLVVGLIALGTGSGVKVHSLNARMAETFQSSWLWLHSLRDFIHAHEHDADFRFAVAWSPENMPHLQEIPFPYFFYRRFIDSKHPTHVLWYHGGKFVGMEVEAWRREHPDGHFCGDVVQPGRKYQVLFRDGFYYAITWQQMRPFLSCPDLSRETQFPRAPDLEQLHAWIRSAPQD